MSHIVIGVPVRDRAWILPHWFRCVDRAAVEAEANGDKVSIIALENDSEDDTMAVLEERAVRWNVEHPGWMVVLSHDFGYAHYKETAPQVPGLVVKERVNPRNDKRELALLRNMIVDEFLRRDGDYLLMWDSDILMPRYALVGRHSGKWPTLVWIMEHFPRIGILAADVEHPGCGGKFHNGMVHVGEGIYNHPDRSGLVPEERVHTVFVGLATHVDPEGFELLWNDVNVPYIVHIDTTGGGGAAMIRREVLGEGARYGAHHQGEDVPLCVAAKAAVWQVCITNGILGTHVSPQVFADTDITQYGSDYGIGVEAWRTLPSQAASRKGA